MELRKSAGDKSNDDYFTRRDLLLSEQRRQIGPKLEKLNLYLCDLDRAGLILLSSDGYDLKLGGGRDPASKIEFELIFLGIDKAVLSRTFHLKISPQSVRLLGYHENSMIIGLSSDNETSPLITCDGFDYRIIEEEEKGTCLQPRLKDVERKVEAVNHYFATTNINDMRVAFYNGHLLSLVASFDLCYYHEIELLFKDLRSMDLSFYPGVNFLDDHSPLISLETSTDGTLKFSFIGCNDNKIYITCDDFDYKIEMVKYFDEKGQRKMDIKY